MFGAEPQETWSKQDAEEFEQHASARLRQCIASARWAGLFLILSVLGLLPFVTGHPIHMQSEAGKLLFLCASLGCLIWFVYKCMLIWASWQSSSETRREYGDPQ